MKRIFALLILFFFMMLVPAAAAAQDGALVKLKSEVLKEVEVVDETGAAVVRLVPVTNAMPGELLTFIISYTNEGDDEARDIVLTNPVPEHMLYKAGSAQGEGSRISYSVDEGGTYGPPDSLSVTGDDGKKRQALPSDYTHIRWQLDDPVPAGGSGAVSFRASVK
jgi:uncharacterized repeat protein (TIGR01451 family)